jgi:hypothetical protein
MSDLIYEQKACPLMYGMSASGGVVGPCAGRHCAWWVASYGRCAVLHLACTPVCGPDSGGRSVGPGAGEASRDLPV